jgi:hypothetical protein
MQGPRLPLPAGIRGLQAGWAPQRIAAFSGKWQLSVGAGAMRCAGVAASLPRAPHLLLSQQQSPRRATRVAAGADQPQPQVSAAATVLDDDPEADADAAAAAAASPEPQQPHVLSTPPAALQLQAALAELEELQHAQQAAAASAPASPQAAAADAAATAVAEAAAEAAAAAAAELPPPVPTDVLLEFEQKLEADITSVLLTLTAVTGVIIFWRGVWSLLDHYMGDSVLGDVCCVIAGLTIVLWIRLSGAKVGLLVYFRVEGGRGEGVGWLPSASFGCSKQQETRARGCKSCTPRVVSSTALLGPSLTPPPPAAARQVATSFWPPG